MAKKVLIIGAGVAGLSAGRVLAENDFEVEIYEVDSSVGGMSKSLNMFNQIVDIGPHRFFSKDERLNDFWSAHTNGQSEKVSRLTRIFYNKKFFYYPLRGFDALFKLGIIESALCVLSFIKAKIKPFSGDSFESWVANAFGYRLYSIFFKSYTQKLWGIECKDLDSDFARQRIKGLNLYEAIKSAFFGDKSKKHKTLVDEFSYPKKGCGVVYENMAKEIISRGGKIICDAEVQGIITKDKKAIGIRTKNGVIYGDIVISTAPFRDMVMSLEELDSAIKDLAQRLKFRNTILVYVEVDCENHIKFNGGKSEVFCDDLRGFQTRNEGVTKKVMTEIECAESAQSAQKTKLFSDNWIYVHSKNIATGRITNFANWTKDLRCGRSESILCLEYWANDDERLWNLSDDEIIKIAKNDLLDSAIIAESSQIKRTQTLKIHKSYPVYERGYKANLNQIYDALDKFSDLYFIGRNGAFKYNNQDHSLLMGLKCADKILRQKSLNLWEINTDYDYQEGKIAK
ncbi:FAD-dependent oxidoreductase [Helicobacter sp. 23-1044]